MYSIIYQILVSLITAFNVLLVARVVFSWIGPLLRGDFIMRLIRAVFMLTEPVLRPVRSMLFRIPAMRNMPVDFSPVIVIMALTVLQWILQLISRFTY